MPQDNNNDPPESLWGAGNNSPPDLSQITAQYLRRLKNLLLGGSPSGFFITLSIFVVAVFTWTAFYTVPSDSVTVVQRFGKSLEFLRLGLHYRQPPAGDAARIVLVQPQPNKKSGFMRAGSTGSTQSPRGNDARRGTSMLAGDLSAAFVARVVQCRNSGSVKFLFELRASSETLRYVTFLNQ